MFKSLTLSMLSTFSAATLAESTVYFEISPRQSHCIIEAAHAVADEMDSIDPAYNFELDWNNDKTYPRGIIDRESREYYEARQIELSNGTTEYIYFYGTRDVWIVTMKRGTNQDRFCELVDVDHGQNDED